MSELARSLDVVCGHHASLFIRDIENASVSTIVRRLLLLSKSFGSNAMSYHYSPRESSLTVEPPYLYFASGSALSRNKLSPRVMAGIGRCHRYVLREGKPVTLLSQVQAFRKIDQDLTDTIIRGVNHRGVADEYMIPVYGPFGANAVVSYGFPRPVSQYDPMSLEELEAVTRVSHDRVVRRFGKGPARIMLSEREKAVIHWIARGKSNPDIATILNISRNSVDTYTRRIFKKLGVNDRITAVVRALKNGHLDEVNS